MANVKTKPMLNRIKSWVQAVLTGYESLSNKVTSISSNSTDTQYPSAKAVYTAHQMNAEAIAELEALIPSQASSSNQLADKQYVNDGISTASATFRGTYNVVSDLSLHYNSSQSDIATALGTAVSTKDNNDYVFVQIPTADATPTQIARIDRYKYNGSAFSFEYSLNNSGFTAAQWAAINSEITAAKVQKLDALPTNAALTELLNAKEAIANKVTSITASSTDTQYPSAKSVWTLVTSKISDAITTIKEWTENKFLQKGTYDASTAVGLADNIRGDVYADEQFSLRPTGGENNEVGGIGVVQQLKGAGAAIVQLFPEGANHDFSGDVSLDGTGGNAEAVLRYSNYDGTVEMGYLLCLEAFVSQTLTQEQLDAISAKDSGKADRDKAVWLTPAGAITSAPTIESGQTEVTFSGWRIAMRVKASEVRDSSASSYWFTSGTAGRQVYDVAVAEGIDTYPGEGYFLASPWRTGSAMEYLNHMAAQGLPTHQVKAMSALLSVTKIGIKTVKSRNLLNPQTGRALLKAYVNDDENFEDNEYTMLGGLPSGSTMAFTSLLTGKTETLTMLDSTHFVIPSDGWLQITGTLPESIIATWDGTKDNTAADEYATESHVWDVTQLFGTKDGGTEGHYYRFAKEGMRPWSGVNLVSTEGVVGYAEGDFGNYNMNAQEGNRYSYKFNAAKAASRLYCKDYPNGSGTDKVIYLTPSNYLNVIDSQYATEAARKTGMNGVKFWYELPDASKLTFTSLFLSASSTSDELTQMPADAIPLSEIQFADNNWSIEEAIYDAPEADANGVIDTLHQCTGQIRIQYSLDAAEQILTLKTEYEALEARVTALENA